MRCRKSQTFYIDDEHIFASFSHKLGANLAGLGWIGKSCLFITPNEPREERFDARKCDQYFDYMEEKNEIAVCGLCLYVCPYGRKQKDF